MARSLEPWLQELGAEQIQTSLDVVPVGGSTERGKNNLLNTLSTMENFAPKLIELGRITPAQYHQSRQQLFSELTIEAQGRVTFVDVLAKKPL